MINSIKDSLHYGGKPNFTKYGPIMVLHNFIPKNLVKKILEFSEVNKENFKRSQVYSGQGSKGTENSTRDSTSLMVDKMVSKEHAELEATLHGLVQTIYVEYKKFAPEFPLVIKCDEGYIIIKYGVGQKFELHCDDFQQQTRRLSCVMYLNEDYEGGELHFPEQNLILKPREGDVILFPSFFSYPHKSLPIRSGTKLAITTWYQ